jgi:hypothetical protein
MQDGKSTRSLRAWYERINAKFFFGELPANVIVRWSEPGEETDLASTNSPCKNPRYSYLVVLNHEKLATKSQILSALVHECVHVATGNRDCHGPAFNEWHEKLTARGAFRKGALLKGITLF